MQCFIRYLRWFTVGLLGLTGCENNPNSASNSKNSALSISEQTVFKTQTQVNTFLTLYAPADTFPINISTKVGEWEGPESVNFKWWGKIIPSSFWRVFYSRVPFKPLATDPPFYATKRFRVNDSTVALLTRVPGAYWSSQVYLFLFDTRVNTITTSLRVAEAWADTGDSFYLESRIEKLQNYKFRIVLNQGECHPLDENYEQFACTDSVKTYVLTDQKFSLVSAAPVYKK